MQLLTQKNCSRAELLQLDFKSLRQLLDLFCVENASQYQLIYLFTNLRVTLELGTDLHAPSLTRYYASANWLERECFDLFGIRFEGHPELKRLILYPEFAGYPLRKNYPIDKAQPLVPVYV